MTGETTVGQMKGPSKTNAPGARRWWRGRPAPLTGRRTPSVSLPPPSLLLALDERVHRRHCSLRSSPRPQQSRAIIVRLHQKGTMVTSSMELRAVSLDACAVEKDSWRRWSAAGQHRHQGAAADGGSSLPCCRGRRRRRLPRGRWLRWLPHTKACASPTSRRGRSDAWSRRGVRLNPWRGRKSPRRCLLILPSPDPSLGRRKQEKVACFLMVFAGFEPCSPLKPRVRG